MITTALVSRNRTDTRGGYERLRLRALGESLDAIAETGLAILIRRGLAAWLEASSDLPSGAASSVDNPTLETGIADELRAELTRLVASMALGAAGHAEARA